jgi:hypothetical protein
MKPFDKRNAEGAGELYSAKRTPGTLWAAKHLERTYKGYGENGERTMLIPPPTRFRHRGES